MIQIKYKSYVSEIGGIWFLVILVDDRVVASSFSGKGKKHALFRVKNRLPKNSRLSKTKPEGIAIDVINNMDSIYKGKPIQRQFELDMDRLSSFTRKVLLKTCEIPRGFVATYGGIAHVLRKKGAARAVGNAEANNPFPPIVPCHRVVRSDLTLGGYGGDLNVKRAILEREGVIFKGNCVITENLWKFEE